MNRGWGALGGDGGSSGLSPAELRQREIIQEQAAKAEKREPTRRDAPRRDFTRKDSAREMFDRESRLTFSGRARRGGQDEGEASQRSSTEPSVSYNQRQFRFGGISGGERQGLSSTRFGNRDHTTRPSSQTQPPARSRQDTSNSERSFPSTADTRTQDTAGQSRPIRPVVDAQQQSWKCSNCGSLNSPRRTSCPGCRLPKDSSADADPAFKKLSANTRILQSLQSSPEDRKAQEAADRRNVENDFERNRQARRERSTNVRRTLGAESTTLTPAEEAQRDRLQKMASQNSDAQGPSNAKNVGWAPMRNAQAQRDTENDGRSSSDGTVRTSHFSKDVGDQAPSAKDEKKPRRGRTSVFDLGDEKADIDRSTKKKSFRRGAMPQKETDDFDDELSEKIERKRERKRERQTQQKDAAPTPIILPQFIKLSNLAAALKARPDQFMKKIDRLGFKNVTLDHVLDADNASLIAGEYNFEATIEGYQASDDDLVARPDAVDKSLLPPRPPVVTIMGHVDHGKTTILDYLRKSSIAATEFGGITQHIGAFSVAMSSGKQITFLDTPGHAAFLSMRQRGANVTDIVILVVAADDSVKPQTLEAIKHAQNAKVPIIVAISKVDKEDANPEKVKQDLARHGIEIEDYGGDTQVIPVSGKTGQGMEDLEEAAVTLAELLDMRAETEGQAEGWVIEATTNKAGRVATVLVRRGTMRPGDVIVAGTTWTRIRTLRNEAGVQVDFATPGTPIQIDGWREQPLAGSEVLQAPDEAKAKDVVEYRLDEEETERLTLDVDAINESRRAEAERRLAERQRQEAEVAAAKGNEPATVIPDIPEPTSGVKEVYFIAKADVSGSIEAVVNSVSALGNEEVRPHILRSGVGAVAEFDVEHAAVAKGHVINFNVPVEPHIARLAESLGVKILDENIIYRLVDKVKAELSEHLKPNVTQRVLGEAEIAQIFEITIKSRMTAPIAGCRIRNGTVQRNARVRVLRDKEIVYDGEILSSFLLFLAPLLGQMPSRSGSER